MIRWYNIYSIWTLVLCILAGARLIQFSVIPSVIGTILGTFILLLMKLQIGKRFNLTFVALQTILHFSPFLFFPVKFTQQDILMNMGVFILFNVWLMVQGRTFMSVYKEVINENSEITLEEYAKRRGFIK